MKRQPTFLEILNAKKTPPKRTQSRNRTTETRNYGTVTRTDDFSGGRPGKNGFGKGHAHRVGLTSEGRTISTYNRTNGNYKSSASLGRMMGLGDKPRTR